MPNEQLISHIRGELANHVDRSEIIKSLLSAGWHVEDINEALNICDKEMSGIANPPLAAASAQAGASTVSQIKLPGVFSLISDGINMLRKRTKTLISIALIYALPVILAAVIEDTAALNNDALSSMMRSIDTYTLVIVAIIFFILTILAAVLVPLLSSVALICAVIAEEDIGAHEAFRRALSKLGSFVWTSTLNVLVVWGVLFMLLCLSVATFGMVFMTMSSNAISGALSVSSALQAFKIFGPIVMVLFIICVLFVVLPLVIRIMFCTWLAVDGKASGVAALVASNRIVRGRVWALIWRCVVLFLVFYVAVLILGFTSGFVSVFFPGAGILFVLIFHLLLPIAMATTCILYKTLRNEESIQQSTQDRKWWVITLATIGCIGFVALIVFSVITTIAERQDLQINEESAASSAVLVLRTQPYVNAELGYSFNPPSGWIDKNDNGQFFNPDPDFETDNGYIANIGLLIESAEGFADVETWVDGYKSYVAPKGLKIVSSEKITVNGHPAILSITQATRNEIQYQSMDLFVLYKQKIYYLQAFSLSSKWDKYKDVFLQSLLTFKTL